MSTEKEVAFDPYHKWLGIPKALCPPTHYQLLGLVPGESDHEVIEEAAIRQTTHLRAYQVGPHAAHCTKLLNEVAAARQVLLNPAKRKEYDARLAQNAAKRSGPPASAGIKKGAPIPTAEPVATDFANLSASSRRAGRRSGSKQSSQTVLVAAGLGGAALLVIVGIAGYLATRPTPATPKALKGPDIAAVEPPAKPPVVRSVESPKPVPVATKVAAPKPPLEPKPSPGPKPPSVGPDNADENPATSTPVEPIVPKKVSAPIVRVDPPPEAKVKELVQAIRETYKADYAKKPAERGDFAEKLLGIATETKDDAAARYALLVEARDVAAAASRWPAVVNVIDQLDAHFKDDLLAHKDAALQILVKTSLDKETSAEAAEAALQAFGEAIVADRIPLASSFLAEATATSAKSQSVQQISLVKKATSEFRLIGQEAEAAHKGRETLTTMPDDPEAHLAVGRFDGLRRGEWSSAIPHLAKGSDAELAAIARLDESAVADAGSVQKAGDAWWTAAEKTKPDAWWIRSEMQKRAAHWYRQAAPTATGLALALDNERLKLVDEAPPLLRTGVVLASAPLKIMSGHRGAVTSFNLGLDGRMLYSTSFDGTIRSWDLKTGKGVVSYVGIQPIYALAFAPSARSMAVGTRDMVNIVDIDLPTKTKWQHRAWPGTIWLTDSRVFCLYAGEWAAAMSNSSTFGKHSMRARGWTHSPATEMAVTYGEETWICSVARGGLGRHNRVSVGESTCAAFSPNSKTVAVATVEKKIEVIEVGSAKSTTTLEATAGVTRALAYAPEGDRLVSGGDDGFVRIWDVAAGKELRRFAAGSKQITSLRVTPDGRQIIAGGGDGVIRSWSMPRDRAASKAAGDMPRPDS